MSLLGVDRVFELAGRLKAACDGAQANKEQCRILARRSDRIAGEIRNVDAAMAKTLARRPGLCELASTLTSGIALCQKYDKKSYLKLIWSHNSDAEKFDEIFKVHYVVFSRAWCLFSRPRCARSSFTHIPSLCTSSGLSGHAARRIKARFYRHSPPRPYMPHGA